MRPTKLYLTMQNRNSLDSITFAQGLRKLHIQLMLQLVCSLSSFMNSETWGDSASMGRFSKTFSSFIRALGDSASSAYVPLRLEIQEDEAALLRWAGLWPIRSALSESRPIWEFSESPEFCRFVRALVRAPGGSAFRDILWQDLSFVYIYIYRYKIYC